MATRLGVGQVMTVETLVRKLREVPKEIEKSLVRAVDEAQAAGLDTAREELLKEGIARSLWGPTPKSTRKRGRGRPRLWTPSRPRWSGDKIAGVLVAYGLAAHVELGGKTKAHSIPKSAGRRGKVGKPLAFLRGGEQVFARSVKHPGGNIPKRAYLEKGQLVMVDRYNQEAEGELQAALDRTIG